MSGSVFAFVLAALFCCFFFPSCLLSVLLLVSSLCSCHCDCLDSFHPCLCVFKTCISPCSSSLRFHARLCIVTCFSITWLGLFPVPCLPSPPLTITTFLDYSSCFVDFTRLPHDPVNPVVPGQVTMSCVVVYLVLHHCRPSTVIIICSIWQLQVALLAITWQPNLTQ